MPSEVGLDNKVEFTKHHEQQAKARGHIQHKWSRNGISIPKTASPASSNNRPPTPQGKASHRSRTVTYNKKKRKKTPDILMLSHALEASAQSQPVDVI
jgi:hypothetical protein